jgi:integrase
MDQGAGNRRPTDGIAQPPADLSVALAGMAARGAAALAGLIKALAPEPVKGDAQAQALPENHIEIDGDAGGVSNPKGHDAMKVFGPYPHKKKWRILIRLGSEQQARSFDTEAEAKVEIRKLRIQAHKQAGIPVGKAIEAYAEQLRRNGVRERSIDTTLYRLRKLFEPVLLVPLATVTPARAKDLFKKMDGSVDSRRNILNQARTFCRRAKENEWTDTILLVDVKGEGKRRCGKQKLTVDESRKFLATCLDRADNANPKRQAEGVAAAMALVFGMRASEITNLQVRDLDAGGTIIRITHAKSQAGIRSLQVPEWFRPYLQRLADGKDPTEKLVGHDRTWLHRHVRAICKKAGITEAPPHGLRGTHADLALLAAATPLSVSKALGHESLTTTYRHYADEGITQRREHERAVEFLTPPKAREVAPATSTGSTSHLPN